jgi:hypothetical protein
MFAQVVNTRNNWSKCSCGKMRKELDKCKRELVSTNQSIETLKSTVCSNIYKHHSEYLQRTIEELEYKFEKAMEQNVFLLQEAEEIPRSFQGRELIKNNYPTKKSVEQKRLLNMFSANT